MTAFALDALAAATSCPAVGSVAVVTDEPDLAGLVRDLGCDVLPDEGAGDLNRVLQRAVLALRPRGPVAAMLGDLPCLLPEDLEQALGAVQDKGFVADAEGTGTTLVAVRNPASFVSHFGARSRAAHVAAGIVEITLESRACDGTSTPPTTSLPPGCSASAHGPTRCSPAPDNRHMTKAATPVARSRRLHRS